MGATGDRKLTLLYNYYEAPDDEPVRQEEIRQVFARSLMNRRWDRIVVAVATAELATKLKPTVRTCCADVRWEVCERPTYRWWFELVESYNEYLRVVLVNSDIYVPEAAAEKIAARHYPIALQRYECESIDRLEPSRLFMAPRFDSQDLWAYTAVPNIKHDWSQADFPLGVPGCDNRIAYVMDEQFGSPILQDKMYCTELRNPCLTIKTYHIHKERRPYKIQKEVEGSYKYVVAEH